MRRPAPPTAVPRAHRSGPAAQKLLLLKDLMKTGAGREMAEGRHRFMEQFLTQFHAECAGLA